MSPVQTTLNVGRWLERRREIDARTARVCAVLGWTEVEFEQLRNGVDFRDILRGKAVAR